jgi:16S rRNA (cytidine1402-2'-O)-methyltransferase
MPAKPNVPSTLFVVPTPIGNLGDITLRAIDVLKSADLILAEDTRQTSKLLRHFGISTPMKAFHMHNEHRQLVQVMTALRGGHQIALVTDGGTPGISDPGFLLVRECIRQDIRFECLPGPTALIPALILAGFPTDRFVFEGFLPLKKGRSTRIKELTLENRTIVIYESPHRLIKTLKDLAQHFGDAREAAVCREMTKLFEEVVRGTLSDLVTQFQKKEPKGEMVIVVRGRVP